MTQSDTSRPPLKQVFREAALSMKDALIPGYVLLFLAALLVVCYYKVPAVTEVFAYFAEWKVQWGWMYSFVCTAFFGGIMPWVFRMVIPGMRPKYVWGELVFCILLWGWQGVLIDGLYGVQTWLFGGGNDIATVVSKVAFDQFGYTLCFASFLNGLAYFWKDVGFSFDRLRENMNKGWYRRIILPNYIANMMIWLPGVSIVYSLPRDLQILMAGLISCLFSLVCTFVANRSAK